LALQVFQGLAARMYSLLGKGVHGNADSHGGALEAVVMSVVEDVYLNQIPNIRPDIIWDTCRLEADNGDFFYNIWTKDNGFAAIQHSKLEMLFDRYSFWGLCFSPEMCYTRCFLLSPGVDTDSFVEEHAPYKRGEYEYSVAEVRVGEKTYAFSTMLPDAVREQYERALNGLFLSGGVITQAVDRFFPLALTAGQAVSLQEGDVCMLANFRQRYLDLAVISRLNGFYVPVCSSVVDLVKDIQINAEEVASGVMLLIQEASRQYRLDYPQHCVFICPEQERFMSDFTEIMFSCLDGLKRMFRESVSCLKDDVPAIRGFLTEGDYYGK